MLVRGNSRQREIAVRLALGASRWRLIRQSFAEGLILALSGAVLGMALATAFSRAIVWFISSTRDAVQLDLGLDWRVFAFTGGLAVLTCGIFDLWPAIRSSQTNPGIALKSGSRGTTHGRERFSFQRTLVISQIAVSMVLLVGALLFVRSFRNLVTYNPGFREDGVVLGYFNLSHRKLTDLESYDRAARELLEQIRYQPRRRFRRKHNARPAQWQHVAARRPRRRIRSPIQIHLDQPLLLRDDEHPFARRKIFFRRPR